MSLDTLISRNMLADGTTESVADGCALVLMGGGARTAYQAGVLSALAAMLGTSTANEHRFPFRWLFGTS
ncbi:MAG: patatin, partial [Hydrogenophaga sp.]|nr:patatin [Hydrogenophaga sp.]